MLEMTWPEIFHAFVIPFLGGLTLTLTKLIADRKLLSFDESNNIALDMVLLGIGALGTLYIRKGAVEVTVDAGMVDAFLAAVLLYLRFHRKHSRTGRRNPPPTGPVSGIFQLMLGAGAIVWTILAI